MYAKDQKEIKGIYYNEANKKDVYFVRTIKDSVVEVSNVVTYNDCMVKVLNNNKLIPLSIFKEFKFSGNYTREDINNQ